MDLSGARQLLNGGLLKGLDVYERRDGVFQIIIPILHEDGDMVEIYVQDSPAGNGTVRLCDYGLTLMRLSYTFDPSTPARQRILDSILINNGVNKEDGNLFMDSSRERLHESILQYTGCVQKVCNMRYWSREVVRSAFYDDLRQYVVESLSMYSPVADVPPMPDFPMAVDWVLEHNRRSLYVFGVLGNDKAKSVAIALLEFKKLALPFISLVVHEDMESLGARERLYLTRNADKQYPMLTDFQESGVLDIDRLAPVPV